MREKFGVLCEAPSWWVWPLTLNKHGPASRRVCHEKEGVVRSNGERKKALWSKDEVVFISERWRFVCAMRSDLSSVCVRVWVFRFHLIWFGTRACACINDWRDSRGKLNHVINHNFSIILNHRCMWIFKTTKNKSIHYYFIFLFNNTLCFRTLLHILDLTP